MLNIELKVVEISCGTPGGESGFSFSELTCTFLLTLLFPSCPTEVFPSMLLFLALGFCVLLLLLFCLVVQASANSTTSFGDCKSLVLTVAIP